MSCELAAMADDGLLRRRLCRRHLPILLLIAVVGAVTTCALYLSARSAETAVIQEAFRLILAGRHRSLQAEVASFTVGACPCSPPRACSLTIYCKKICGVLVGRARHGLGHQCGRGAVGVGAAVRARVLAHTCALSPAPWPLPCRSRARSGLRCPPHGGTQLHGVFAGAVHSHGSVAVQCVGGGTQSCFHSICNSYSFCRRPPPPWFHPFAPIWARPCVGKGARESVCSLYDRISVRCPRAGWRGRGWVVLAGAEGVGGGPWGPL